MDAFLEAYLNLDQVKAWAETRDPQLVRFASASPEQGEPKSSATIALLSIRRATELKQNGRDVDAELWAASGWLPPSRPFIAPAMAQSFADELGVPIYRALVHKDLQVQWPKLPEAQGPPHVFVRAAFPTEPPVAPQPSATEDEVRSLIQRELEKHGGFFSQENGAGIVRGVFPRFPKKRAMELVKEATGNETRGPRGPRKKLCG